MRKFAHTVSTLLGIAVSGSAIAATPVIPPESKMGQAAPALQRLLLNSLQAGSTLHLGGGSKMIGISSRPASADVGTKMGWSSLEFLGMAEIPGAKGAFRLSEWWPVPGQAQMVGMWVYLPPEANVTQVGLELGDSEDETLAAMIPADWTGWKWVELDIRSPQLKPLAGGKNQKVDLPLRSVRVGWLAKTKGPSRIAVSGLCALTDLSANTPELPLAIKMSGPGFTDANQPFRALIDLTNLSDKGVSATIDYSVQHDATLDDRQPPHPIYGSDEALGAKSWTEGNGEFIEQGSLTDGRLWTLAQTQQVTKGWDEAFQYIDLNKPLKVTRMTWESGDAGRLAKVDVSISVDGKTYTPVASLQNVEQQKKWGLNTFVMAEPFEARYLRFRYHSAGAKVNGFNMPPTISVYDGIEDESLDLPAVGRVAASGTQSVDLPSRGFTPVELVSQSKLAPGAYRVAIKVRAGDKTYFAWRNLLVKPEPIASLNPRLGLNVANPKFVDDMQTIGLGWGRFENLKWPMVSVTPGVFDYTGTNEPYVNVDGILGDYRKGGIDVLPFVFLFQYYGKEKPAATQPHRLTPEEVSGFADYTFQTIARYGSTVHPAEDLKTADKKSGLGLLKHVEIWNEQNHADFGKWNGPERYYRFFREAAEAAKKADPKILISNGGFSGISLRLADGLRTMKYDDGKRPLDYVDVLSVHFYTGRAAPEVAKVNANTSHLLSKDVRTFEENLSLLSDWRDRHKPGMPIWMTETGYDTDYIHFVDERTQAAWMSRDVMLCLANGIDKVLVYRELGSDNGMWAAAGVMRSDGTPKPSYFSYATLARELKGVEGSGVRLPVLDPNVRIYAWKRGTKTVISAWVVEGTADFPIDLGQATVVDCFGDRQSGLDTATLKLTGFPIYISEYSNRSALDQLIAQAAQSTELHRQRRQQEVNARVYAFGFGGTVEQVGGIVHGEYRPSTPVLANQTFDAAKGYGFAPTAALENIDFRRNDPQNQRAVRINKGMQFRFKAEPGHYTLRVGIAPSRPSNLTVSGQTGGDATLPIDGKIAEASLEIEVGQEPVSIEVDGNAVLRWLTLIEKAPSAK